MNLGVDAYGSQHRHPPTPRRRTGHEPQWSTAPLRSAGTVRRATLVLQAESTRGHSPGPLDLAPSRLPPSGNASLGSTASTTGSRRNGGSRVDARGWLGVREFRARAGRVGPRSASRTGRTLTSPSPATRRHNQYGSSPYFVKSSSPILAPSLRPSVDVACFCDMPPPFVSVCVWQSVLL
ncbi:hypothetical protein FJTKL_09403 [Diaporthe vaccinii]|uniref:Uncharacterized protein n=1 Tax=Diaporthe vaccinii TaxID=105482 RepID=A0ABR4FCL7_9PEZI